MIAFQLDQCLDSKRFVRNCTAEGRCQLFRLPPPLRGAEDPQLLAGVMAVANPLVTFDRSLAHEHTAHIPQNNPGIIVISNYPAPQTLTVSIAQKVLAKFKSAFQDWHQVSWRNSVVEITSLGVEVWHVASGKLVRDAYFAFDTADWQGGLRTALHANART